MPNERTFTYIGFAAITLLLFGLAGWYFFISRQTANIEGTDLARGFDISIPSFAGSRGSTVENIVSGFGERASSEKKGGARPPRLWHVNATPSAGFSCVPHGTAALGRFVERSTGHVFDADPEGGTVVRRTNTLLPKIYAAHVQGETVIERFLRDDAVTTFVGQFGTTTEDGLLALEGVNLGAHISDIAFLSGTELTFIVSDAAGTHLVRTKLDGTGAKEILLLAAGDFKLAPLSDGRIVLVERAASGILGNAYEVSISGTLTPLMRGVPGLTLLPHASSEALLIGTDSGAGLSLAVKTSATGTLLPLSSTPTTAEKCAWAPQARSDNAPSTTTRTLVAYCAVPQSPTGTNFLDNWYRGTVHTTDSWYVVDGSAGTAEEFFAMNNATAIDVERPVIDKSGNYIAFMNASDKSLWLLRIAE
mgnify:CR=1 FL=1